MHGRSIYKANIAPLQAMHSDVKSKALTIFEIGSVRHSNRWGSAWTQWLVAFEPEETIQFYSNASGEKSIKILSEKGAELKSKVVNADKVFNYTNYNLDLTEKGRKALLKEDTSIDIDKKSNGKYYLPKGIYLVQIDNAKTKLEIK